MPTPKTLKFTATREHGQVSALLLRPKNALAQLMLAHCAGTDMRHHFMEALSQALAQLGIATFRYNFPYKEKRGGGGPNKQGVLTATVRAAAESSPLVQEMTARFACPPACARGRLAGQAREPAHKGFVEPGSGPYDPCRPFAGFCVSLCVACCLAGHDP